MNVWIEKYRPKTTDEVIGNADLILDIKNMFNENGKFPNIILYGPPGIGKTTIFTCLLREKLSVIEFTENVLEINASNERSPKPVLEKLDIFVNKQTRYKYKYILLEELDNMTTGAQQVIIDFFKNDKCVFFCTCNNYDDIIQTFQSNCIFVKLRIPTVVDMSKYLKNILIKEKIEYDETVINDIAERSDGDMRVVLNNAQSLHYVTGRVSDKNLIFTDVSISSKLDKWICQSLPVNNKNPKSSVMLRDIKNTIDNGNSPDDVLKAMILFIHNCDKQPKWKSKAIKVFYETAITSVRFCLRPLNIYAMICAMRNI